MSRPADTLPDVTRWQTTTFARLNQPVAKVIGEKSAKAFAALKVRTVGDLLRHVPRRYLLGTENSDLRDLPVGEEVAIIAEVADVRGPLGQEPRMRIEATLTDGSGRVTATFFGKKHHCAYWAMNLKAATRGIFVGKVSTFNGNLQLTHPTFVMFDSSGKVVGKADQAAEIAEQVTRSGLVGLYPATSKLPTWTIGATIDLVLDSIGDLSEPLPAWVLEETDLPTLQAAYTGVHRASTKEEAARALERLQFDEALALQLVMARRRADNTHLRAPVLTSRDGGLLTAFDRRLPFALTRGQLEVSSQIFDDLAREVPMQRLLQGEVGSGKTLVALRAMLAAVDSGHQAALLAPTEVLAAQHLSTIIDLLGDLGQGRVLGAPAEATQVVLLTGSQSAAERKRALFAAASGEAGIVIGTHALLADRVQFADLSLVVVDEQHRFGVEQRSALTQKAELSPHVLVMTATPIPRSVAMTVFGDLETSLLTEIPAGRSDVQTTVVDAGANPTWVERAWQRVTEEVAGGRQAFVVCSTITAAQREDVPDEMTVDEDPAPVPPVAVEDLYAELSSGALKGLSVGMLHGRMSATDKDEVMGRFAAGEIDVLVATTVIEVGVNVPNASVMVVMDADRFGISQLHQLRGRIGRGEHPGLCLLLTHARPDSPARTRLDAVAGTRDGFLLAEADLAARREGNVLGANQSGTRSTLRLIRVLEHADLIVTCRDIAAKLVADDPDATNPHLNDIVTQAELDAAGDWLERA
ncbi:ATP-dependent DNA helicase RecG [Aestuariimicrobium kwangyangense]|uniref:ATP-dependent DNA helicase RecG n=1 Tax=Aestuariimicrobium kwangyangense TaxID=396389 RepID=UPI00047D226B